MKKGSLKKKVIATSVAIHLIFPSLSFPISKVGITTPTGTVEYCCDKYSVTYRMHPTTQVAHVTLTLCSIPLHCPTLMSPLIYTPCALLESWGLCGLIGKVVCHLKVAAYCKFPALNRYLINVCTTKLGWTDTPQGNNKRMLLSYSETVLDLCVYQGLVIRGSIKNICCWWGNSVVHLISFQI